MRSRALLTLSALHLALLGGLWALEESLAERVPWVTVIAYVPQHPLLVIPALLCAVALFRRDFRALAVNAAALAFVTFGFMGFVVPSGSRHALQDSVPLRLMVYNLHQDADTARVIRDANPDVLCLQESRDQGGLLAQLTAALPRFQVVHEREFTVLSRFPVRSSTVHRLEVSHRPLLEVTLDVRGVPFTLVNAHFNTLDIQGIAAPRVPWQERVRLNSLARWDTANTMRRIASGTKHALVLCGDFNTPPRGPLYGGLRDTLEEAFAATGLGFGFSYRSDLPVIRIDHVFANRFVRPVRARVLPVTASDHRPLVVDALVGRP